MKIAGLDPGRHTALVIVDEIGVILHFEQIELEGDMVQRSRMLRDLLWRSWHAGATGIVIEDVSHSHHIGARKGAQRRTSHSIASVQRDFAAAVALATDVWPMDRIVLALVAQWYPRIAGQMVKKEMCLRVQKERAERANPEGAKALKNEHLKAAYGLAMYGQGSGLLSIAGAWWLQEMVCRGDQGWGVVAERAPNREASESGVTPTLAEPSPECELASSAVGL